MVDNIPVNIPAKPKGIPETPTLLESRKMYPIMVINAGAIAMYPKIKNQPLKLQGIIKDFVLIKIRTRYKTSKGIKEAMNLTMNPTI